MICEQPDRTVVMAQCQFPPDIGYATKLSAALSVASRRTKIPHWQANPQRGILRDPEQRTMLYADHRLVQLQTLGLGPWSDRLDAHAELFKEMLGAFSISTCSRLLLELRGFLRLGMSHGEIVDLFYGTFLNTRDFFRALKIEPVDGWAQIDAKCDERTVRAILIPMKAEEVAEALKRLPNIEAFREHPVFDVSLKDWHDRLVQDSFQVHITIEQEDVSLHTLQRFFRSATILGEELANKLVRLLKSLPLGDT